MEKLKKLMLASVLMLAFLTGFISNYAVNYAYIDREKPFLIGFGNISEEPGNWLSEDNIKIYEDKVVIYVENALLGRYTNTGSMLPVLGSSTNGIKIKPENPEQIKIGDIISYEEGDKMIVHRVIEKGKDDKGYWFATKGDNNTETDGKIYWEQIKYVVVALIY